MHEWEDVISQLFIDEMRFHTNDCLERVEEVEQGTMNIQYLKEIKMEREIITEDVVEASIHRLFSLVLRR